MYSIHDIQKVIDAEKEKAEGKKPEVKSEEKTTSAPKTKKQSKKKK